MSPDQSAAKAEVLRRIKAATEGDATSTDDVEREGGGGGAPRAYRVSLPEDVDVLGLFIERVQDYQATVITTAARDVRQAISTALGDARRIVVPRDLVSHWRPDDKDLLVDDPSSLPLDVDVLDGADAVLTGAAVGIAETGTIVLDGGPGQGRRAITLIPDLHVCVIRADQVLGTVPQAVRSLDPTRPQTWISGPSATSDIELERVEGVHGPRTLRVVLITG